MSEAGKSQNSPPPLAGGGRGEGAPGSSLLSHARALRRDATPAERRLWQGLRRHQVNGLKFRRQVPLGPYIADFYCASAKLVIEVDGISHINSDSDSIRDAWMGQRGIRVVRVANRDVVITPRIGITQAADWPLRYLIGGNPYVSKGPGTAGNADRAD